MTTHDTDLAASGIPTQDTVNAEEVLQHAASTMCTTDFENQTMMQRQHQQNQSSTSTSANGERKTLTSSGSTAITGVEDQPIESIGEALESDTFKSLRSSIKPLPVSLQRQVLDWTEELLRLKDKIQVKKHVL